MTGLSGLGHLECAAGASYLEPDELPLLDPESDVHDDDEGLAMDIVPESDPEDDETLLALAQDFRDGEKQAAGID